MGKISERRRIRAKIEGEDRSPLDTTVADVDLALLAEFGTLGVELEKPLLDLAKQVKNLKRHIYEIACFAEQTEKRRPRPHADEIREKIKAHFNAVFPEWGA